MTNGDAGVPTELGQIPTERDFDREFAQASEVGKLALGVARERSENSRFGVKKYSVPMLNPEAFPQDAVNAVTSQKEQVTEDDVKTAREASVRLAIDAAAQIVNATTSSQTIEDSYSLEQMAKMVNRGASLIIQVEASDPQLVVKAAREALKKGGLDVKRLEEEGAWTDRTFLGWTKEMFKSAGSRLRKGIDAIEAHKNTRF